MAQKINFIKLLAVIALLMGVGQLHAQRKPKFDRNRGKIKKYPFPSTDDYRAGGWLFGAGIDYTFQLDDKNVTGGNGIDNQYSYSFTPINKPGLMLEIGRYYNFKKPFIFKYFDYSLAYKSIRGGQDFDLSETTIAGETTASGTNSFGSHYASANFNLNNIIRVTDFNFILNSIGVNADYRFIDNFDVDENYPVTERLDNADDFVAQVHYRLGWGYKSDVDRVWIFSLETPVFNILPSERAVSQLDYFNMPFRTVIFRVQFLLFRYGGVKCPPVNNPSLPGNFQNGYGDD
tara:strand:+ start:2327 stop:3196 length:870 start_codon:yes stop_codon:yes gene_type:complete